MKTTDIQVIKKENTTQDTLFTPYAITTTDTGTQSFLLEQIIKPKKVYKGIVRNDSELKDIKRKRIESINKCTHTGHTDYLLIKKKDSPEIYLLTLGCNFRGCPNCADRYRRKARARYRDILNHCGTLRFMTVSFKNPKVLTREFLLKCAKQFNRMREYLKRENKRYSIGNYISVLEIKLNKKGDPIYKRKRYQDKSSQLEFIGYQKEDNWNVHYHIIYEGGYIPVEMARECLKRATKGDSFYVDIQNIGKETIRNRQMAISYITKYLSKMSFRCGDPEKEIEYYNAIRGIRFVKCYLTKDYKRRYLNSQKTAIWEIYKNSLFNKGFDYYEIGFHIQSVIEYMKANDIKWIEEEMCLSICGFSDPAVVPLKQEYVSYPYGSDVIEEKV